MTIELDNSAATEGQGLTTPKEKESNASELFMTPSETNHSPTSADHTPVVAIQTNIDGKTKQTRQPGDNGAASAKHNEGTKTSNNNMINTAVEEGQDAKKPDEQGMPPEDNHGSNREGKNAVEDEDTSHAKDQCDRFDANGIDMPKQKKLQHIFDVVKRFEFPHNIGTEIRPEDIEGNFVITGRPSAGKTSTVKRLVCDDFSPSSAKVTTLCPQRIIFLHTPGLCNPVIDLVLPALTKTQREREILGLSSSDCKQELIQFHELIRHEKGRDKLSQAEVKITIRSSSVPNMIILDTPGSGGKADDDSKMILENNLNKAKKRKVNTIVCSSVRCSSVDADAFLEQVGKVAGGDALVDFLIVYTHIDKSDDQAYQDFYDEDDPDAEKSSPFWQLNESLEDQQGRGLRAVGLLNKNTQDRNQRDVSILDQSAIEDNWKRERVKEGSIPEEVAKKIGLKALLEQLDELSMSHLETFIKRSHKEAEDLKAKFENELEMLGMPLKLENDLQEFQNCLKDLIAGKREHAEELISQMITGKYSTITQGSSDLDFYEGLNLIKERFAGGDFALEVQEKMKSIVQEVFDKDNEGPGMQICRFENLSRVCVDMMEVLAHHYSTLFRENIGSDFRVFMVNYRSKLANFGLDNVIENIVSAYADEYIGPLFAELQEKVPELGSNWSEDGLLDESAAHASKRKELDKKLEALNYVIDGWKDLLPDEIEMARMSILSPPPRASHVDDARNTPPNSPPPSSMKSPHRKKGGSLRLSPTPKKHFPLLRCIEEGEVEESHSPKRNRSDEDIAGASAKKSRANETGAKKRDSLVEDLQYVNQSV